MTSPRRPAAEPGSSLCRGRQKSDLHHPLASLGGTAAFPPAVWSAFSGARRAADRKLLAACGIPASTAPPAHLGTRPFILASQVIQLEAATGTTLLHTGQDERLALTADGRQFARGTRPALESLTQSRNNSDDAP